MNSGGAVKLMVAPNGARRNKTDHPALPITIDEITAAAVACHAAGAQALHAHVRDDEGGHSLDAGRYRELLAALAAQVPALPVQITTESAGRYAPAAQRQLLYDLRPAWASVAVREIFADEDVAAATRLFHWAAAEGVRVQHIVYSPADIAHLQRRIAEEVIPAATQEMLHEVLFVLGQYAPAVNGAPPMLDAFLAAYDSLPPPKSFMVCAFGSEETACLLAAARAGGGCRVGFENNLHHADGRLANDNAERVAEVVAALADL